MVVLILLILLAMLIVIFLISWFQLALFLYLLTIFLPSWIFLIILFITIIIKFFFISSIFIIPPLFLIVFRWIPMIFVIVLRILLISLIIIMILLWAFSSRVIVMKIILKSSIIFLIIKIWSRILSICEPFSYIVELLLLCINLVFTFWLWMFACAFCTINLIFFAALMPIFFPKFIHVLIKVFLWILRFLPLIMKRETVFKRMIITIRAWTINTRAWTTWNNLLWSFFQK